MNLMGNLLDLTLQILPTLLLGCNLDEWKRQISPDKGGDQVRQQGNYPHQTLCCEFKMVGCSAFLIAEVLWGRGVACLHWCFIATTCGPELWDIPVLSAFQPCQDLASVFHEKSSVLFT